MLKYLIKVYFDSFEVPALYFVRPFYQHWPLLCAAMPLVRPRVGPEVNNYLG